MVICFEYSGRTNHLNRKKRKQLEKELYQCTKKNNFNFFFLTSLELFINGSYELQDYFEHEDIEWVLDKYDIDWKGGTEPIV